MKIHIDDNVVVIAGKDRGKTGKVVRRNNKKNVLVVEKVNLRTKHIKKQAGQEGQRISYEAPINSSNVMVICPHCSKKTRVAHVILTEPRRKKQRICKKCNQSLDTAAKKTAKKR